MTRARLWGYFAGTALVGALVGFLFGWYQAYPAQHTRDRALLRLRLSEARARALDAQIALVRANYGLAREHLAESARLLEAFKQTDQSNLPPTEAAKVDQALVGLQSAVASVPGSTPPVTGPPDGAPVDGATALPPDQAVVRAELAANLLGEVYRATPEP